MAKNEKNFLLVSLDEDKAKKLAQVISNETCRKILEFLTKKEATETEISNMLKLPISTVHYNLKQLSDSGLVVADEYHYSQKGREINHYSLANKYIIIAPKSTESLPQKLRQLLPVALIIAVSAAFLQIFANSQIATQTAKYSAEAADMAQKSAIASAPMALTAESGAAPVAAFNFVPWFAGGALFALLVYLVYDLVKERFRK